MAEVGKKISKDLDGVYKAIPAFSRNYGGQASP